MNGLSSMCAFVTSPLARASLPPESGAVPFSEGPWQVGTSIVAIIGGLIAAFKAVQEMGLARRQREREFAWNQAKECAALLSQLDSSAASSALLMLDWSNRAYTLASGDVVLINAEQVHRALRTTALNLTATEGFIRDRFDALFGLFERVERAIQVGLVREEDLLSSLGYYIKKMAEAQDTFENFMATYGYRQALQFAARLPAWRFNETVRRQKYEKGAETSQAEG